jgi:putative membrane protein
MNNLFKIIALGISAIVAAITFINPIYPREQFLQQAGTVLLVALLLADLRKRWFSNLAFLGIALFLMLHLVGTRYIYSYVPYQEWLQALGDWEWLHTTRNHYDRLVHLLFGVLLFPALVEFSHRRVTSRQVMAVMVAWLMVQAGSLIYELFEWALTLVLSPEDAEGYNGQQGDLWDAHKDMALAMLGSTVAAGYYIVRSSLKRGKLFAE